MSNIDITQLPIIRTEEYWPRAVKTAMSKEDREYIRTLIRERLRGIVEIPPDNILNEIIADLWDEFLVIQTRDKLVRNLE